MQLWIDFASKLLNNNRILTLNSLCFHVVYCLVYSVLVLLRIINQILGFGFFLCLLNLMERWAFSTEDHSISKYFIKLITIDHLFKFLFLPVLSHSILFFFFQLFFPLFHNTFSCKHLISIDFLLFDVISFSSVFYILRK